MSIYKATSVKRVLSIIACTVLCCLSFVALGLFGGATNNDGYVAPPVAGSNSAAASAPYRNYSDISVELFASDVVFYNGFSTGYGIKENLKVTGVYNGKSYVLSPDEFYVTAGGLGEIEKLDFATNPQTLSVTVNVPSGNKTLTAQTEITIEDNLPVFTDVTATGAASVSADNTAASIKNEINVKGTVEGKEITVNRELYSVSALTLNAGSNGSATLDFADGVYSGAPVTVTFASVKQSSITGIAVTVSPSLTYESGYYKNGEFSAFVNGMPFFDSAKPSVFSSLDVYVFYDNSSEKANFTVLGNNVNVVLGNSSFKNVTANVSGSTAAGNNNITLTITLASGTSFTDSITLPFENKIVADIKPIYKATSTVYSYTSIDAIKSNITVVPVYNDGSEEGVLSDVTFSGTLTPASGEFVNHKEQDEEDWEYSKEITVSYITAQGRTISRDVLIENIVYKKPAKVNPINKPMQPATQTLTYDFDYTGFYFEARYTGTTRANYYLSDISYDQELPIYKKIVYCDEGLTPLPSADNTVPKGAVYAEITVNYFGTELNTDVDFIPVQAPIDYPYPSEFVKDYDENCVITISGEKKYMDYINVSAADSATAAHVDISKNQNGDYELAFNAGGEYYVNAVITDGDKGVYRFKDVIGESNIEKSGQYTVTYHFVINKGEFDLSLEYASGADEWVYGGTPAAPTVIGTLGGRRYTIKNQDGQDGLGSGELGVPYVLYYYGFDGRTYDDIIGKSYAEIASLASTLPKDVGEYYVAVITKETDAYAQSTAFRWNAHVVEITAKPLTLSIVNNAIYTRGTSYSVNDIINTTSFAYEHKVADVMTVTATNAPFTHAGTYDITIKLTNANYKWASGVTTVAGDKTTTNAKFTISKRDLDFTVSVKGFTYGDASVNLNPVFGYRDTAGGAFTSAKNNFYAVVGTPVYYHATSAGGKTGAAIDLTTSPMNTWAAGKYYVEYTTSVDTANGDKAGDYNLPTAGAAFDVGRRKLTAPAFTGVSGDYDGEAHDITIVGYGDIASSLVNGDTFDGMFTVTTEAKRTDNNNGYQLSGADISSTVTRTDGVISVTEAGSYKVTIAFKSTTPDYEWTDGTVGDAVSDLYTINKKELTVNGDKDGDGNEWAYNYDGGAHTPVLSLIGIAGHTVTATVKIYTDSALTSEIAATDVTEVGDYYIKVTDYSVTAGGASIDKANYKLPVPSDFPFHIVAAGLNAPVLVAPFTGSAVSTEYTGNVFAIGDFIVDWATEFKVGGVDKVNIAVYGNGATATLKNVLYLGDAVTAYKVYIYPKDNYDWVEGVTTTALPSDSTVNAYEIDFTVTQLEVELAWVNTTLKTEYNGTAQSPTVNITNKKGSDAVSVEIGFTKDNTKVTALNAGKYVAYAKSVNGAQSGNYKVSTSNDDYEADFVITKKLLIKPVLPTGADNAFNGTSGTKAVTASGYAWADYENIVSVTASGKVPSGWFVPTTAATEENITDGAFNVKTGTFSYTRAGEYTFTVSLDAYQNYCFDEDEKEKFDRASAYTYTAADTFTVNRKQLTAPDIHSTRAQEWDKNVTPIPFGSAVGGVNYTVKYGNQTDSVATSDTWLGGTGASGVRGIYFAELTLSVTNALNYVWVENTVDTGSANNGLVYVDNVYANYYYGAGKVAIRLYYAITSSQIDVEVAVKDYTFGDNGIVDGVVGTVSFDDQADLPLAATATVYLTGTGVNDATGANAAKLTGITFVNAGGAVVTELVNGLPWVAGKYTLRGTLAFGNGETYQSKNVAVEFEVLPRPISVKWDSSSLSAEYDSESHMATATISTVVKKSSTDTTDYTVGLTLVVKQSDGSADPVNFGDYAVAVKDITAEGVVNNFTLPDAALTETLHITAKAVTLTGDDVANHFYRDEITDGEKRFTVSTDAREIFNGDGAADFVQVKILNASGDEMDRSAIVGTYRVVVSWKADAGVHATNYDVTFKEGSFTVIKRTLTVTLNADNAKSEYGDPVSLYDANKPIYTVTSCKGQPIVTDALGGLTASDVFNFTCTASDSSAVGDYQITATAKDGGFDIKFSGEWKYSVINAAITDNGTIDGIDDTTYKAANINVLKKGFEVTTKKNTAAKWHYAFVDSPSVSESAVTTWTEFTASPTVYNAGDYYLYVKVTASNHDPLVKLVSVHVDKAELTVKVDLAIKYGENNPVTENYKMSIKDLRTVKAKGGIYTVTGLRGNDSAKFYSSDISEKFYNLSGDVAYTVDGFTGAVTTYVVNFTAGGLSCDNYTFISAVGTLTVNKIKLTVDIKNQTVVYHTPSDSQPDLTIEGENGAYKVTLPESTYDKTKNITLPDGNTYADIFALSSAAITDKNDLGGGRYANTAGVGEYPIIGTNKLSDYYEVVFVGNWNKTDANKNKAGTYTVTSAELELSDISGFDIRYDEKYHGLTVTDKSGNPTEIIATAVDGSKVTVLYYESNTEVFDFSDEALAELGSGSSAMPKYINVKTYYVVLKATAANHTAEAACYRLRINYVSNSFVKEFAFANGKQFATTVAAIADGDAAWVYGLFGTNSADGYNKDGDQAITEPQAEFTRLSDGSVNVLTVRLSYSATINGTYTNVLTRTTAGLVFEDGFNGGAFKAGYYRLSVTMPQDNNYDALSKTWAFKVAKRNLTVTASDVTVMFGDKVADGALVGKYDGLVLNSTAAGATVDTITDAIGDTLNITTDYVAGKEVGTYTVFVMGGQSVNYTVAYVNATLTVTPREVTVTIDDKENTYNLQNGETPQVLTFRIVGSTLFYDVEIPSLGIYNNVNQPIIKLFTDALTNSDSFVKTNDVIYNDGVIGGYSIYAKYASDFAKKNYIIKFASCAMNDTRDGAILQSGANNAGKYTIKQATFSIEDIGVFHMVGETEVESRYYSGAPNYYKAQFTDNPNIEISFTYSLRGDSANRFGSEGVVNIGRYTAYAFTENHNYTAGAMSFNFEIYRTTLTLTADNTTIEYGTTLPATYTADRFGGFSYTSSSVVSENGESETLTPETLAKYIQDNPVTFTSTNYTAKTAAGTSTTTIIPVCNETTNVRINAVAATLTVVRRNVTVTIVGYDAANSGDDTAHNAEAWCYYRGVQSDTQTRLNEQLANNLGKFIKVDGAATFGASGDGLADLGVKLSLPVNAVSVTSSGYGMTVYSDAANYRINFITSKTADGVKQNRIEYSAPDAPVFMIKKAPLTLYANVKSGNNAAAYTVVYGSAVALEYENGGTLSYAVDGMKNGELFAEILGNNKLAYTVMCGVKAYAAWDSTTQETYVVSIAVTPLSGSGAVEFENYEITAYKTATLNISKLAIEASTVNQVFEKAADGYHDGIYGKSHEAVITFGAVGGSSTNSQNINVNYRPSGFTLSYNTNRLGSYQVAGAAPTVVGDYKVTVALAANGNYTFAGGLSATLPFSVTKRILSDADLVWARTQIAADTESSFENTIQNYVNDIMVINSFMFTAQYGGGGRPVDKDATSATEYYTFGENGGLTVYFGAEYGTYVINFKLKDSATSNYEFESKNGSAVISSFIVSGENVVMTVKMADFIYRDTPSDPVVFVGENKIDNNQLVFTYGKVTDISNISNFINKGDDFGGFDYAELSGLKYDTLKALSSFDAGYYVLYAFHPASSQSKYFVFQVKQKAAVAPTIVGEQPSVYNGQSQQLVFEYDLSIVRASYDGSSVQNANGSTFFATYADDYTISFRLVDPANYKWADTVGGVADGVWTHTWTIGKDTAEIDYANPYISMPTVVTLTYGQEFSRATATVKAGYEGNVTYYYMVKSTSDTPSVNDSSWVRAIPSDADEYWLKAVVSDGNANFTDKATVSSLVINKKEVTATAYYTLVYGDEWTVDKFKYVVDGLLYGNKETEIPNKLKAVPLDDYGKLVVGGEYYISLDHDDDGVVLGLDAGNNYVIKAVAGPLTIVKRDVTVTIGSLSGYYTVTPDVTGVGYTVSNLGVGDDKSVLGIVFTTDATGDSGVNGQYWITAASYKNSNYNVVQFNRGVYTVKQLTISVALTEQTGLTYGDSGIVGATMGVITCDVDGVDIDKVRKDLKLSFTYTGRSFGGVDYVGNTAPTAAGNYVATLVGVNDNYTLVGSAFVEFTIAKKAIDVTKLSIANQPYTGKPLTPVVKDNVYGSGIYTVAAATFTDAGSNDVWLTLVDSDNYRWSATDATSFSLTFIIDKIADALEGALSIRGWQYGDYDAGVNSPSAVVKSGERITYQYSADGVSYTSAVPENGNAGTYYVRVFVEESKNYIEFVSAPVAFDITRRVVVSPSLTIITAGNGKNDVYTGSDLASAIIGFNPQLMQIVYDGSIQSLGENVTVFAHDADVYRISVSLFNARNYCWSAGDTDDDGTLVLEWTVARKKVAKPTHDSSTKIVNGNTIVYLPIGFDSSIMAIENNAYSYGGNFVAKITLKDTKNYEWADGGDQPFTIKWSIVGADSVFAAIISVLVALAVVGGALIAVQFLMVKRRRRVTEDAMRDIEMGENQAAAQAEPTSGEAQTEQAESEKADEANNEGNEGGSE